MLAEQGLFPEWFGSRSRLGAQGGLAITTAFVLLVANLVDLSAIASVGSAVSLIVFVLVGAAGYRRRADTGSSTALVVLAIAVTAIVLGFFAVDIVKNDPADVRRDRRNRRRLGRPRHRLQEEPQRRGVTEWFRRLWCDCTSVASAHRVVDPADR